MRHRVRSSLKDRSDDENHTGSPDRPFAAIPIGAQSGKDSAYESTKRLTDILALTSTLDSVRPYTKPYLDGPRDTKPPGVYLVHPGVVATPLMPLPFFIMAFYAYGVWLTRLLGSPWHAVTGYNGGFAAVWLALRTQQELDALRAERCKWGSSATRWAGNMAVKRAEVAMESIPMIMA